MSAKLGDEDAVARGLRRDFIAQKQRCESLGVVSPVFVVRPGLPDMGGRRQPHAVHETGRSRRQYSWGSQGVFGSYQHALLRVGFEGHGGRNPDVS